MDNLDQIARISHFIAKILFLLINRISLQFLEMEKFTTWFFLDF